MSKHKFGEEHFLHCWADEEWCDDCDKHFCWKCEDGRAILNEDKGEALCGDCADMARVWEKQRAKEKASLPPQAKASDP